VIGAFPTFALPRPETTVNNSTIGKEQSSYKTYSSESLIQYLKVVAQEGFLG